jgi:dTMP kinase
MRKKALFITFEGGDKCGKSTQISLLEKKLKAKKIFIKILREPGHTYLGEKIRNILLHGKKYHLSPFVEFQLFTTARRQLTEEVLLPFLRQKKGILILDRFFDSTYVYQGIAGGLPINDFKEYEKATRGGLVPDLTFLLDLPVREAQKRCGSRRDRMERKSKNYHEKVRRGYLKLAKNNKKRFVVIDSRKSIAEIHKIILKEVEKKLA